MACPMCRYPVTFGGGMGTTYDFFFGSPPGLKYPFSSHHAYMLRSTDRKSYWALMLMLMLVFAFPSHRMMWWCVLV